MESINIRNLTFTYPNESQCALDCISICFEAGEFITICGKSGSGKSTLLRQLKPVLCPHGKRCGSVFVGDRSISDMSFREQSERIGFVMQSSDNQIVTEKVWHELSFGLENLGYSTQEIRARVAEMASFFGIQTWFHKDVSDLSGGQKQILNLAAVMVMSPDVLILDEPTSQLDPIAAHNFLQTLSRINRELGTTILLSEHRLEETFPLSDRVVVMDNGKIIADGIPGEVGRRLKNLNHDMFSAMPTAMRICINEKDEKKCPITVSEGRKWLFKYAADNTLLPQKIPKLKRADFSNIPAIELNEVWFRYKKDQPDVISGMSIKVNRGEIYAIVGGNGTGKTTALSIIRGVLKPYRGSVMIDGVKQSHGLNCKIEMLPQNPQSLFVKKTIELDLYEIISGTPYSTSEKERLVNYVSEICEIKGLLGRHPYDISGGEQQRAALAKILLLKPRILLLDEPTKWCDAHFKQKIADILLKLRSLGITVLMVSHDIEFCAEYADRCAMFFDGGIVSESEPRTFFSGKSFYTTAANRIAHGILHDAILAEDIILACGGVVSEKAKVKFRDEEAVHKKEKVEEIGEKPEKKIKTLNITWGCILAIMFALTQLLFVGKYADWRNYIVQFLGILFLCLSIANFIPQNKLNNEKSEMPLVRGQNKKRTLTALAVIVIAIPITIFIGVYFLSDRKYNFISILIIFETIIPFLLAFEKKKPPARELVVISLICALAVAGRAAFFMFPQFKPVIAIVIIAGTGLGSETGFLVGVVTGFVSNFFFGQGPWTPWQMFALGIIGFLAGIMFKKGHLHRTKASLCIFGGLVTFIIYGGIMNPASVIMWQAKPNALMFLSAYIVGLPFDLAHSLSTMFFLWVVAPAMLEKFSRIKAKFGILN